MTTPGPSADTGATSRLPRRRFSRRGTFWSAAAVLALCLWSSGAPSVLYPIYAAEWNLPAVVITSVFATYPVALLIVLLLFGSISDTLGRRRTMMLGIALFTLAALVFAVAPNVGFLYLGRVLQGIGVGFALGAASAALVENNPSANPRLASTLTTVSTATGLTVALVLSGVLAEYAPLPLVLSFLVLFALSAVTLVAVWRTPSDVGRSGGGGAGIRETDASGSSDGGRGGTSPARVSWRPKPMRLAPGILLPFAAATTSVAVAYAVGAIFLSLGAQMARDLSGTTDLLVIGLLLGISSLAIGVTALFLSRVHAHLAILIGGALSLVSLALMALAAATGSLGLFLAWCVVGGIAYSFSFTGGIGVINRAASATHRGGTLSLLYLFAYLLQALVAVGAGALATAIGLGAAVDVAAPLVGVFALAAVLLAALDLGSARRRRAAALSPSA